MDKLVSAQEYPNAYTEDYYIHSVQEITVLLRFLGIRFGGDSVLASGAGPLVSALTASEVGLSSELVEVMRNRQNQRPQVSLGSRLRLKLVPDDWDNCRDTTGRARGANGAASLYKQACHGNLAISCKQPESGGPTSTIEHARVEPHVAKLYPRIAALRQKCGERPFDGSSANSGKLASRFY